MIKEFKKAIQEWAELCGMEIKLMRKSKNYDVIFVYGVNEGEYAGLDLNDFLNGNHSQWKKELNKGFNRAMPKIVRTYIDPEYLTETIETEETPVIKKAKKHITESKTIKFDDLMTVMKKYVATNETRPVLKLVNFDGQYFTATDSHHIIRVNSEVVSDFPDNLKETFLYDPKEDTAKGVNYNYPDTSRLIPNSSNSTVLLNDNIKELHKHVKEVKKVVKKDRNKVMKLVFKQNETLVSGKNEENSYSAAINNMNVEGEEISLHVSSNYLNIAIEAVKKLSKLSNNNVEVGMTGHMRPIHFKQEGIFDIMVLPVRTY